MAIAIRPIPVLTGEAAERFEAMVEASKNEPYTQISQESIDAMHAWIERSKHYKIKLPN